MSAAPPQPSRRRGPLLALVLGGCGVFTLILVLALVVGGVLWLGRSAEGPGSTTSDPALATHDAGPFTVEYPADWELEAEDPAPSSALHYMTLEDEAPEDALGLAERSFSVYQGGTPGLHAKVTCEQESARMGWGFDSQEDPTELEGHTLEGEALPAWQITGVVDGQDAVQQLVCADVGEDVLLFHLTTVGSLEMAPEVEAILESVTVQG